MASALVAELCAQAGLAVDSGFAGVMTSEHHGGFPGYLPNPLRMVAFILDECPSGGAAACPLLLPLRPTAMMAEEVAWLAARHSGRVGLGVAAAALPLDFEAMGLSAGSAVDVFPASCLASSTCCRAGICANCTATPPCGRVPRARFRC